VIQNVKIVIKQQMIKKLKIKNMKKNHIQCMINLLDQLNEQTLILCMINQLDQLKYVHTYMYVCIYVHVAS
jgi:hypothetical protein